VSTVLVVDDEPLLVRTLAINLRAREHRVRTAPDGATALELFREERPDLVVLDLGLPDLDGTEVLRQIRAVSHVPVIVLSARAESTDKVEALDLGADDYVTKPFGMEEFLARVRAALRRVSDLDVASEIPPVHTPHLDLDFAERTARVGGADVHLTPTEWRFLEVLARRPGHLVTHRQLLQDVWGPGYGRESNYLRVYANLLRRKIEPDASRPQYLVTATGHGYRLLLPHS
jgi:two-component system KDP operon response regulator KdpE